MLTFILALVVLVIAVMHGTGRGARAPLWLVVAPVAIGEMILGSSPSPSDSGKPDRCRAASAVLDVQAGYKS
jgi:hypothetical protein